jgi:hypothetical protein
MELSRVVQNEMTLFTGFKKPAFVSQNWRAERQLDGYCDSANPVLVIVRFRAVGNP